VRVRSHSIFSITGRQQLYVESSSAPVNSSSKKISVAAFLDIRSAAPLFGVR
jgi:hypothetical protein